MRKIVVFDLDDTLYNEIEYLKSAFKFISGFLELRYKLEGVYDFMIAEYHAKKNVFEKINSKFGLNIPVSEYLSMYRNHIPDIKLDGDTRNTLVELKKRPDVILGIITDGRCITQSNKILALGLYEFVDESDIIISEKFGFSKPSKEAFLFFSDKYANAIYFYIGDNTDKDFFAPNLLGWNTICLLDNGLNIHGQNLSVTEDKKPAVTINQLNKILSLI